MEKTKIPGRKKGPSRLQAMGRLFCHSAATAEPVRRSLWKLLRGVQNAHCYNRFDNGENWLVQQLAPSLIDKSVLDIGANVGDWSAVLHETVPEANIYAVEMIPRFAAQLRERFGSAVTVIECGISDTAGCVTAYQVGEGGGRIQPGATTRHTTALPIALRTGDEIVAQAGITDLALIKIDVDGYDVPALRGLGETIAAERPVIQFEYSRFYIETRHYLRDAYEILEPLGYRIGRLMPARIDYLRYHRSLENFLCNNYIAVPSDRPL